MAIKINGTNTAAAPGITGDDTDTGLVYGTNQIDFSTGGTSRATIDSSGNLGLGTSSPDGKLHVEVSSSGSSYTANAADTLILERNGGNVIDLRTPAANDSGLLFSDDTRAIGTLLYNHPDNSLRIGTNGSERMRIDSSGHLTVTGDEGVSAGLYLIADQGDDNGDGWRINSNQDVNDLTIAHNASGSYVDQLTINSSGVVFSPPTYSNVTGNSANMAVPNSDGQFYRSTSSIKYKDNVATLTDTLADKILDCRPVSYTSKCANDDKTKVLYGLIAEEVDKIDQSLVFYNNEAETPEPEGVQYDRFVPALLNLVKRQKVQIEALEARVTALEAG